MNAEGAARARYEVECRIGAGGMAELFLARRNDGYVVLKTILPSLVNDARVVAMFLDEARLLALLQHENIVGVVDAGNHAGAPFIAMEYLRGQDLRRVLASATSSSRRRVPLDIALAITAQAAAGLQHVHTRADHAGRPLGIVHRDVSPSNVFVGYDGRVKLLDFGIAKPGTSPSPHGFPRRAEPTRAGQVKGKLRYLAPEQVRGGGAGVDARTDVFALGLVLFELVTGRRAYAQGSREDIFLAVATGHVPAARDVAPDVPPALDRVIRRATAAEPWARFASAAELGAALAGVGVEHASRGRIARYMREVFARGDDVPTLFDVEAIDDAVAASDRTAPLDVHDSDTAPLPSGEACLR